MNDCYELNIWSRNYEDSFERQVERVHDSLLEMSRIEELVPRYLTAMSKDVAPELELTKENIEQLIKDKEDKKFPQLGSELSLFTSKDDNKICGIRVSTGKKSTKFVNSITVNINFLNLYGDEVKRNQIIDLFNKLIEVNDAFYACIVDNENHNLYDGYYNHRNKKPKSVFWVNYWGKEITDRLPQKGMVIDKIKDEVYQLEQREKGCFIRLSETTVFDDEEKIALQSKINRAIGLESS